MTGKRAPGFSWQFCASSGRPEGKGAAVRSVRWVLVAFLLVIVCGSGCSIVIGLLGR